MKKYLFTLVILFTTLFGLAQTFYKIDGNGLKSPSYLFGTHHLAPLSLLDSIPKIKDVLSDCEVAVGEIDMTQSPVAIALSTQKYMLAPPDSTLSQLLSKERFADLESKFAKYSPAPGLTLSALSSLRPMAISAAVTLGIMSEAVEGYNPNEQLDAYFQKFMTAHRKAIIALETPEEQARLLYSSTPIERQIEDLESLLDDPEGAVELARKVNEAYFAGNLDYLYEISASDNSDPEFTRALLVRRNRAWAEKLPAIMEGSPAFIAVGALHLPGPEGLISLLREAGYVLTPLN